MTTHRATLYIDRSAAETDDKCPQAYWWNRREGGRGIVPTAEQLPLLIGAQTHEDLKTIADMKDISPEAIEAVVADILKDADRDDQAKMELLYRRVGWLAAFALYIEPKLRDRYDTIQTEDEFILDRDPLWIAFTPDRVLRDRHSGMIHYREYKTTIDAGYKWMNSWKYKIQLHIGLAGLNEELNTKVAFAQIQALLKGNYYNKDHRLSHPYVWAWFNHQLDTWSMSGEDRPRGADWVPMPVWEYPGGVVKWVQLCGLETALNQFPQSPPVFLNPLMLDEWVRERTFREQKLKSSLAGCVRSPLLRSIMYPKHRDQCQPAFGDPCPYLDACWNAEVNKDPLKSGKYVKRIPHHEVEVVYHQEHP